MLKTWSIFLTYFQWNGFDTTGPRGFLKQVKMVVTFVINMFSQSSSVCDFKKYNICEALWPVYAQENFLWTINCLELISCAWGADITEKNCLSKENFPDCKPDFISFLGCVSRLAVCRKPSLKVSIISLRLLRELITVLQIYPLRRPIRFICVFPRIIRYSSKRLQHATFHEKYIFR